MKYFCCWSATILPDLISTQQTADVTNKFIISQSKRLISDLLDVTEKYKYQSLLRYS